MSIESIDRPEATLGLVEPVQRAPQIIFIGSALMGRAIRGAPRWRAEWLTCA
jgi:hypothetical protein